MRPLQNRIANTVARGVIKTVDDAKKVQILQVELLGDLGRGHSHRLSVGEEIDLPARRIAEGGGDRRDRRSELGATERWHDREPMLHP